MVPASNAFWAVALFCVIGLIVSLGLAYVSGGTGLDPTVGSVPIETTTQAVQAVSTGH
jgi:hypothetical protein